MTISIVEIETVKLRTIAPRLSLAFTLPVDSRLDALQRRLLATLSNACRTRGGALYGPVRDVERLCDMTFWMSDLERLYELGCIDLARDGDWCFIEVGEGNRQ